MAARALLALPELDDEDATRAARDGSDTMVLVRAEHDRVAGVHKSGLVAGVADELACEINDRELYISLRVEMAWGTRPRAAIKIVARPREHHVKRVYATAIVVLLVPQCAAGCDRVILNDSRHDIHSRRKISEVRPVRCPRGMKHAGEKPREPRVESSISGQIRRGPQGGARDRTTSLGEASARV
jgi:hypothetical protein